MRWYASLRRRADIARVRRRGKQVAVETFACWYLPDREGPTRIAVTVSKAVGPAVVRNLVRRRLKGALDALALPAAPVQVVFVVKPLAARAGYARLAADVAGAVERLGARR